MVGAHVDITELKLAEAARHASEERLRLAQEAAGLGIWERDLLTGEAIWSAEQYASSWASTRPGPAASGPGCGRGYCRRTCPDWCSSG